MSLSQVREADDLTKCINLCELTRDRRSLTAPVQSIALIEDTSDIVRVGM